MEEEIQAEIAPGALEDSAEADSETGKILEVLAEAIEGLLRCMMLFAINAEKSAKFLSSQAGRSQFTAATALEKAKILNQGILINIKKSLT